ECQRVAMDIFAKWEIDPYPRSEGWQVIYRQDSPLKIADYWRKSYQEKTPVWQQQDADALPSFLHNNQADLPIEPPQPPANLLRKKFPRIKVKTGFLKELRYRYKGIITPVARIGQVVAGTLLFAIALDVISIIKEHPNNSHLAIQRPGELPLSIRELFTSKQAPGSIAVGVAEGNLTPSGKPTAIYLRGHTDPGNFATNKGFCSWNKAQGLSIAQADKRCLASLQLHSVAIENHLIYLGLDPKNHKVGIVMGTDLWNQSNSAGPLFPLTYRAAQDQGFAERQGYIWARVEAFRNEQRQLDASGLFGICRREPYYRQQLVGLIVDSEPWRWNCIKLDQRRRILEIENVLK
ncbi:MAG TPA: hypothetical protein V6C95_17455, partial [Coleofasciculaceae cyanobacterium]